MKAWKLAGALGLMIAGLLPATGAAAEAQHASWINTSNVPLDLCPGNASVCQDGFHLGSLLGNGTAVTMQCWTTGRANSVSDKWFYVTLPNRQGFVKAEYVSDQWLSSPYCGSNKEVNASLTATSITRFGVSYPAALGDRQIMAGAPFYKPDDTSSAGWGPEYGWAGDCISYAALAWHSSGVDIYPHPMGNAIDTYNYYRSRGQMQAASLDPPRGALVFWHAVSAGTDYGHVMVSLGDGVVVGTQGWDTQYTLPTHESTVRAINSLDGPSIGWFEPA